MRGGQRVELGEGEGGSAHVLYYPPAVPIGPWQ